MEKRRKSKTAAQERTKIFSMAFEQGTQYLYSLCGAVRLSLIVQRVINADASTPVRNTVLAVYRIVHVKGQYRKLLSVVNGSLS